MLVYPYFNPKGDGSQFRVPPLGLGYLVACLREGGFSVGLVDCTFLTPKEAVERVLALKPAVVGIYSMFSMFEPAVELARAVRAECRLLVAGGPLPSVNPAAFLEHFDLVVKGEGEATFLEAVRNFMNGKGFADVRGVVYNNGGEAVSTGDRAFFSDLDALPFPARDLFPNEDYVSHWRGRGIRPKTSIITTRGCPFHCDFCSNVIFGVSYRERSARSVVDEVEQALRLGYEAIFFVDDCFTLNKKRVVEICDEIGRRGLKFDWECLSRVDGVTVELARRMKEAGCTRVFFGIESGNEEMLKVIGKNFTLGQARVAVNNVVAAGIRAGAFFIVGYPGETDRTILDTIEFSSSLPLDYLSYTLPYPIPGTGLFEKVKDRLTSTDLVRPKFGFVDQAMIFRSRSSAAKLKFAILKGTVEFNLRRRTGRFTGLLLVPFKRVTDLLFRIMP